MQLVGDGQHVLDGAAENYAAADVTSPRSVAAYVAPSLFLALVVDRVVAVVRRHVLGDAERSVWAAVGRAVTAACKGAGLVLLTLAERGDLDGLRARADAGDEAAAEPLAALLIVKGCGEETERLRRFGLNPDGSIAGA